MIFAHKKIWLIGASVGIGEALAHALSKQGAILSLSARSQQKLDVLIPTLQGNGHIALSLDVMDNNTIQKAWDQMLVHWGLPDIVIYNAGTYEPMGAKAFNIHQAEIMVDVNFRGSLRILSYILPAFFARGSGHIVLVGSVAGYSGLPNAIGYGASKAALIHLAENLHADLQQTTIKVQLVNPGFVKTRLTEKNTFAMPFIITPETAAQRIVLGMSSTRFEIAFPMRFVWILKFLRLLPYSIYFWLLKKMKIAG